MPLCRYVSGAHRGLRVYSLHPGRLTSMEKGWQVLPINMEEWPAKCRLQREEKLSFTGGKVLIQKRVVCLFCRGWKENPLIWGFLLVRLPMLWQLCIKEGNAQDIKNTWQCCSRARIGALDSPCEHSWSSLTVRYHHWAPLGFSLP